MKIDAGMVVTNMKQIPARVRELEEAGFDGCFTFEGPHEPFMPLVLAAEHSKLDVGTGLAIAFARTPMTVANLAHDLQQFSGGRFWLGLGSQIRPHIEARYSMPWGKPVTRMKEFVRALRAIFANWNTNEKLDFRGEFYTHTLMPPIFNPGPSTGGPPPIYLGGVGPKMTEAAGEVADGMLLHPFHTERSLEQVMLPNLQKGLDGIGTSVVRLHALRSGARGHWQGRSRVRKRPRDDPKPNRVLRFHSRISQRARGGGPGRASTGASPAHQSGALARDGIPDRR